MRLSRAQLETLAIVAYRQPITRPEIDEIRGVDSSATLRLLLDRSLIRVLGKKEEVGRPMLYGTTKEFLDFFSLGDLRELPTLREYSELTAESRKVMSDRLGIDLDAPPIDTTATEEMLEAEPAPLSIDDMVASYNSSMDTTDEATTQAHVAIGTEEPESTLEALAARRNADAENDVDEAFASLDEDHVEAQADATTADAETSSAEIDAAYAALAADPETADEPDSTAD